MMYRIASACYTVVCLMVACSAAALAGEHLRHAQDREGGNIRPITSAELVTLSDPLFHLLLNEHADERSFEEIERLIQPDAAKRHLFIVSESIASHQQPASRRAVMAFSGENGGVDVNGNVMLSFSVGSSGLPASATFLEAWGWDNHRSRYNFYRLDSAGSPGRPTWKFRGSSHNADLLSPVERRGTCVRCHVNGAPIMKELFLPWNNWHSLSSAAKYLVDGSGDENVWPLARQPRFKQMFSQAERLEPMIVSSIRRFNSHRINHALERRDDNGDVLLRGSLQTVVEGRRLLRPLFEATEFNIISARQKSGTHPLSSSPSTPESDAMVDVEIPETLFLNAHLIAGGGAGGYQGLGLLDARRFRRIATMKRSEYKALLRRFNVQLAGKSGDTDFAWLIPEPSHIDVDLVDQLMRRGIVTRHFVAATIGVDLREPLYLASERRDLAKFVPNRFQFQPAGESDGGSMAGASDDAAADPLTQALIVALEASNPQVDSRAGRWLKRLKSPDAVELLRQDVASYLAEIEEGLAPNAEDPNKRSSALESLYRKALDARRQVLAHQVLGELDETGGRLLFPLSPPE